MRPLRIMLLVLVGTLGCWASDGLTEGIEKRVIILANDADAESMRLAHHYAQRRGIPEANIFGYSMSMAETITWKEFVATIWAPLMSDLVRTHWIDAIRMDTTDAVGRQKYATQGHRISYLVVCRGVPLRIAQDPLIKDQPLNTPVTSDARMQTNQAAVDSELTVLAMSIHPIMSYVPNPLFQNDAPNFLDEARIVKVSRLDGPNYESARLLVDNAIEAETNGLSGRAYLDIGGPYVEGDLWFMETEKVMAGMGYEISVDRSKNTFPSWERFDAPILYFGWYAGDCNGPMAQPGFRFPVGAIAYHLHSYSATSLRDPNKGWCGPLVARGATATLGNVYEPFLSFTHRPQLFLRALTQGKRLGDAAFYSLPALSWQSLLIGDPLYCPFAKSFETQWSERHEMSARLAGYVVLRKMKLLEAEGKPEAAMQVGKLELSQIPSLPLALGIASRLAERKEGAEAAKLLDFVRYIPATAPDEWTLLHEAARIIAKNGDKTIALSIYSKLLENKTIQIQFRRILLEEGLVWAQAAGDMKSMIRWQKELVELGR